MCYKYPLPQPPLTFSGGYNLHPIHTMRKPTSSTGTQIDWDKDYPELSKANQLIASLAEALKIIPLIREYEGRKYISNIDEIFIATEAKLG